MITFKIGGVHPHDNKIAKTAAIDPLAPPAKVAISMAQHLGAPATPIVAKGDKVLVGQVIGEPAGFISAFVYRSRAESRPRRQYGASRSDRRRRRRVGSCDRP